MKEEIKQLVAVMHQKLFANRHKTQEEEDKKGGNQANQNGGARHIQKVMLDYYCCTSVFAEGQAKTATFRGCL